MKKLWIPLSLLLSALILSSCSDDDGYSLNDYWLTTGTFMATDDYFYIVTDEGDNLWPSASNISADKHDDGERILVNYTILQDATDTTQYDYFVKVNGTSTILTKDLFTFTSETTDAVKDSIGNDAITIKDTWFTDNYLNMEFEYGGGYGIHYISLVKDETDLNTGDGEIILELKHNGNDDPYNYVQWGLASFDLSELQVDGEESVDIFVRALDEEGNYKYNKVLTYEYGVEIAPYSMETRGFSEDKIQDNLQIE